MKDDLGQVPVAVDQMRLGAGVEVLAAVALPLLVGGGHSYLTSRSSKCSSDTHAMLVALSDIA